MAAAVVLAAGLAACGGRGSTKTTDVPLAWVPLLLPFSDGGGSLVGLRMQTSISVQGSPPIATTIDTGSSGLQLLAKLLSPSTLAALPSTGATIEGDFPESGIQAKGYVASATVSFGEGATTDPIPVSVLQELTCLPGNPCDAADGGPLEPYVFNGVPALLGLGMRNSNIGGFGNPIVQLPGEPSFIIEAPPAGSDGGILRIAPLATETSAYATVQLANSSAAPLNNGAPPWNDMGLPACIIETASNRQFCGNALLDTGTPWIEVNWSSVSADTVIGPGAEMSVTVGDSSDPLASFQVTVGSPPQLGLDYFVLAPALSDVGNFIVLGLPVFARYDVFFDQARGRVGLLRHTSP